MLMELLQCSWACLSPALPGYPLKNRNSHFRLKGRHYAPHFGELFQVRSCFTCGCLDGDCSRRFFGSRPPGAADSPACQVTHVYDADGALIKKIKPDGTSTLYLGSYEVELSAGGALAIGLLVF
jgi:hypothetical protein